MSHLFLKSVQRYNTLVSEKFEKKKNEKIKLVVPFTGTFFPKPSLLLNCLSPQLVRNMQQQVSRFSSFLSRVQSFHQGSRVHLCIYFFLTTVPPSYNQHPLLNLCNTLIKNTTILAKKEKMYYPPLLKFMFS